MENKLKEINDCKTSLELDEKHIRSFCGYTSIVEYYESLSCDHLIEQIKTKSLFINNK